MPKLTIVPGPKWSRQARSRIAFAVTSMPRYNPLNVAERIVALGVLVRAARA
jgi:hypothetical protein